MWHMYDWDMATMTISPEGMKTQSGILEAKCDDVASAIKNIQDAVFDLKLGWAGDSADEATAFGNRWTGVMTGLFGTEKRPKDGVLNVIAGGVKGAAVGFSHAEVNIRDRFSGLLSQMHADQISQDLMNELHPNQPSSAPDKDTAPSDQPSTDADGHDVSAVSEDFPG